MATCLDNADDWDPFAEEEGGPQDYQQEDVPEDEFQPTPEVPTVNSDKPAVEPTYPSYHQRKRKAEEAKLETGKQLKAIEVEASQKWKKQLEGNNKTHINTAPITTALPAASGTYSKIHPSHRRVTLRNIVFAGRAAVGWQKRPKSSTFLVAELLPTTGLKGR